MKELISQELIRAATSYYDHFLRCRELDEKEEALGKKIKELKSQEKLKEELLETLHSISSGRFLTLMEGCTEITRNNFENIRIRILNLEVTFRINYSDEVKKLEEVRKEVLQKWEIHKWIADNDLETAKKIMNFAEEEPICLTPGEKDAEKVEAFLYLYFGEDVRWRFIKSNKIDEKSTLSESFMELYKERRQQPEEKVEEQIKERAEKYNS